MYWAVIIVHRAVLAQIAAAINIGKWFCTNQGQYFVTTRRDLKNIGWFSRVICYIRAPLDWPLESYSRAICRYVGFPNNNRREHIDGCIL